jgi:hypothetical protein
LNKGRCESWVLKLSRIKLQADDALRDPQFEDDKKDESMVK